VALCEWAALWGFQLAAPLTTFTPLTTYKWVWSWLKKKKNVLCLASTNWAVLWDRPLATTLTVHTNEYRGCVWKWVNSICYVRRAATELRYEVVRLRLWVATISRPWNYRSLLKKSPIKETIFYRWAAVWGRPLAITLIVHSNEYRGYLSK